MKSGKAFFGKIFLTLILVSCLLATLGGCGAPSAPSEREVESALQNSSAFFDYFDSTSYTVDEFAIIKRQTNEESGTDTVWVQVAARDEYKSAQLSYIMSYVLYNDGWKLENISPDMVSMWEFTPLQGPTDKMVKECIPVDAVDLSIDIYLEENRSTVTYSIIDDLGYCIKTDNYEQILVFNSESGTWVAAGSGIIGSKNDFSPIEGTAWQYLEDSNGARLELDSINPVTLEATGSLQVMVVDGSLYGSTKYEKILSDCVFRFEGESLIMVDYASQNSDFRQLEFRHDGGGAFSVIVSPHNASGMRRPDYYLERVG